MRSITLSLKENMDLVMKNIISEKDLTAQAVGFVKEGPHCSKENVMGFVKKTDPDVKEGHY